MRINLSLHTEPAQEYQCGNCDELDGLQGRRDGDCDATAAGRRGHCQRKRLGVPLPPDPLAKRRRGSLPPWAFPWWPVESRVKMADDLGDDWWESQPAGAASSPGTHSAPFLRGLIQPPPPLPPPPRPYPQRFRAPPLGPACGSHRFSPAVARTAVGAHEHSPRGACDLLTRGTDKYDIH